jgi:hypothetical protein
MEQIKAAYTERVIMEYLQNAYGPERGKVAFMNSINRRLELFAKTKAKAIFWN